MKKIVCRVVCVMGFAAALASCSSTYTLTVDEYVPEEESAVVTFVGCLVSEMNGIGLKEALYDDANKDRYGSDDEVILTVPAGESSFVFHIVVQYKSGNIIYVYTLNDIELQYTFEAGKEYEISGHVVSTGFFSGTNEVFVTLRDVTGFMGSELLKEWKMGEADF